MSAVTAPSSEAAVAPRASRSSRMVSTLTRAPATVLLAIVAILWLVPTIGLLVSSFRTAADNADSGWWTALTAPAQLSLQPYRDLLSDPSMVSAFVNTVLITVPSALLVVAAASLAAYAFAWMRFPGRDVLFLIVVGLLVVPLQVALIPVARLYDVLGLFGTIPAVVLFHVAFGLPFAIFLLRNFFVGLPHELLEAARMDGAGEWRVFTRVVLPLGLPGDRVTVDLPVPLGVERPARRAGVRRGRYAAHDGRDPGAAALVQREHRRDRAGRLPADGGAARSCSSPSSATSCRVC